MKKLIYIFAVFVLVAACSESDDSNDNGVVDNYNRAAMQTNLADNIIIPSLESFKTSLETFSDANSTFVASPDQVNLDNLRAAWLDAYKKWQLVEPFDIGQAEVIGYRNQMNIYPTDVDNIESNIENGNYDLTHDNNNDAVGFPALDYMLYGLADSDTELLNKYQDVKYITYLTDLIEAMSMITEEVLTDWTTNYRSLFVSSTNNTLTSAVNKFINDYIFYFEKGLRANKIGIPAGVFSTNPLSEKAEAIYNGSNSRDLAILALDNAQNIFNGKTSINSEIGEGFYSYLVQLGRTDLATLINTRIDDAREKILLLNQDLKTQVEIDNTKMNEAYDALQLVVVSLKVDMLQAFDVSVDYQDADGD
ncbi:peptidase M75 superfamily protein [Olleya aquimaris]|uniref:Imelysin family protein n=1 Tax=Olleya sediminilitoris TaxID=2795739 RepID=A0ABS1WKV2_9FLAO|nr:MULTISPECIES: imelysin family protein [Olleya]AXO81648.1 peptidase M75 superfamily protein [Olleya aquimaris]MBL7559750.1 imelysin family protein [Olleya sediminilitoris]